MSLVDEDLEAELHEIYDQKSQENNSINIDEKIKEIEIKDDDLNKYMRVQNFIKAKENIQIEIYFPKNVNRREIENKKIRRILELKTKEDHFQIEIEIKILTVPLKLLLSCNNYKLEYMNDSYYLKTNELFPNEELIFNIQNYFGEDKRKMKIANKILDLKGNTSPKPKIKVSDDKIKISLEDCEKRLNCKIIFYFDKFYEIPIVLNSAIIPSENIFQVYDFLNKCFKPKTLDLIFPNKNNNKKYFFHYIPKNKLEINLHFLIITPHNIKDNNLKATIQVKSQQKDIIFDFKKKEIELEKKKTEFNCKVIIDYNYLKNPEIGYFICNINGNKYKIYIKANFFSNDMKENVDFYKLDYNEINKTYNWNKINYNELNKEEGYICPFGQWNNKISRLIKDNKNQYILEPNPKHNNIIYFISDSGEINKKVNANKVFPFLKLKYPLFGSFGKDWYPLIPNYEDEKELFETFENFNSLVEQFIRASNLNYMNFYYNYNNYYNSDGFIKFLEKYYPYSYNCIKTENKLNMGNNEKEWLQYLYNKIQKNKILDILKRFKNIKSNSFSFSYLANLIFEKPENTLKNFKLYFPEYIKFFIIEDLEYVLDNIKNINKDQDKYNLSIYYIIVKIYKHFKNKKEEIERNNNLIGVSNLDLNDINKKIKELNDKFYTYDEKELKMAKYEEIIQDIIKSKEEDKKKVENSLIITADKFLIFDNDRKEVDINTKPIEKLDIPNNNFNILEEIDEIIQPKVISINSIMEFFENCIYKTQIFPAFIRHMVISKKEDLKIKATNIFSELYNIYKSLENSNHPLISKKIDEYKKSFEIMFSKLKQSGIDFSQDNELNQINSINSLQNQDFIIEPKS